MQEPQKYQVLGNKIVEKIEKTVEANLIAFNAQVKNAVTYIERIYDNSLKYGVVQYKDNLYVGLEWLDIYELLAKTYTQIRPEYIPFYTKTDNVYDILFAGITAKDDVNAILTTILNLVYVEKAKFFTEYAKHKIELEKIVASKNLTKLEKFIETLQQNRYFN